MKNLMDTQAIKPQFGGGGRRPNRAAQHDGRTGLDVLLYLGRFRPSATPDFAHRLLDEIVAARHRIVGIIVSRKDPLRLRLRSLGLPVWALPQSLDQPLIRVKAVLKKNRAERRRVQRWMDRMASLTPDIGVIFYGNWLPPALFTMPKYGFLNYHPAPLPELRGVEPDTFCVLEGRREVWGTVHIVSEGYDEGHIVERTAKLRLTRFTTPHVVWHRLTELGIVAVVRALCKTLKGTIRTEEQKHRQATDASRARAHRESFIRWETDSLDMIHRRWLAYCGQDIRIRLKAWVHGHLHCIRDLELHRGIYAGKPGEVLGPYSGAGRFHGQPMVRARNGVAVLLIGARIAPGAKAPEEPAPPIVPPGRRRLTTSAQIIRKTARA